MTMSSECLVTSPFMIALFFKGLDDLSGTGARQLAKMTVSHETQA
ncbi:hypothetical protein ACFL96_12385 [Thermoproteota archaeon]